MLCAQCGHENPDGAKFCGGCGRSTSAELQCNACGHGNPAGQRFCNECGEPLGSPPSSEPVIQPATPLSGAFGGGRYQVRKFLGEGARKHGGHELALQGDGFLIAFASARQGLLCAIAIQRAFAAYSEAHPEEPIRVRIGLHTGEAIKDADGFFGRTVILASRSADQAAAGKILASSVIRELTHSTGDLRFGTPRDVELKGIADPQRVYDVPWD